MEFYHLDDLDDYEPAQRETRNGSRVYVTPQGHVYPTITSILGCQPKPGIEAWRKKVGEEEADRIMKESSTLGTAVHDLCEKYLYYFPLKCNNPEAVEVFNRLRFRLKNINNIYGLETALHSDMLKVAGTADCIGEYNGILSLIDFKTSRKPKREEWIEDYYIQTMFYAAAFYEMFGALPEQVVILIAVRETTEVQTFIKPIGELDKYMDKLLTIMKKNPTIIQQD